MTIQFSPQQLAFLAWAEAGSGSCVLEAVAGAGKTTVLIEAGVRMTGGVAYMAYNRKIVDETKVKLEARQISWKKMQANTAHGFALAAYRKLRPNLVVDGRKVSNIVTKLLSAPGAPALLVYSEEIAKLVSLAKQQAFGIAGASVQNDSAWMEMAEHYDVFDDEDVNAPKLDIVRVAQQALAESSSALDLIDFDDMIYMPLLHRCRFWQHDVVMMDEAQDTNPLRRALVRAMLKRGGRMIAVGDRHQGIYGFTGADADALDLIAQDFACAKLPLTVSYRCPQEVVRFAQQWVGHIEAAPTAPLGSVSSVAMEDFFARNDLDRDSAVLCRTNKQLVSLAFALIRRRVPCRIEGRDVASRIQKLITRWKVRTLDALEDKLELYLARETTKLLAKKQETKLADVSDAVETVRVIIDQCRAERLTTTEDAVRYVDQLFGDSVQDMMVLSSIHKSKGREWKRVFWLDRAGTCPSRWARQQWQQDQETNLMYVAATRAQEQLVELLPAAS